MKVSATHAGDTGSRSRWLWYIAFGSALAMGLFAWGFYGQHPLGDLFLKWAQAMFLTVLLFGYLLKWGWRYRKSTKFWGLYAAVLIGHCAVYAFAFAHGPWPIVLLAIIASFEIMAIAAMISVAMDEKFW